jgi:hypothetical protein
MDVLPVAPELYYYIQCTDGQPQRAAWMVVQELRQVTCLSRNADGGWLQQLQAPYKKRVIYVAEGIGE